MKTERELIEEARAAGRQEGEAMLAGIRVAAPLELPGVSALTAASLARIEAHVRFNRRYYWLSDIAQVCGLRPSDIDVRFRPTDFAMPRDFFWTGAAMLFAENSLAKLADALFSHHEPDAAMRLRSWLIPRITANVAEREEKMHLALAEAVHLHGNEPVKVEKYKRGWLADWEAQHNA